MRLAFIVASLGLQPLNLHQVFAGAWDFMRFSGGHELCMTRRGTNYVNSLEQPRVFEIKPSRGHLN